MHRTFGYLSKRFVQIRPGEGRKVLLTFLYFFLIITAYYVIKPVSRSLVLGELGARMVPYVDLVCAIVMGPIVALFARLVDRIAKPKLVSWSFWVIAGILIVFWRLLHWPVPWIAGAFYIWVAIFSVLVVTLFWLVANDLYHPREAKRLFGFIGSGGILGGIVGSSIAAAGAQLIGTDYLLLLSSGILLLCWVVVQQLWQYESEPIRREDAPHQRASRRDTYLSNMGEFAKLLLRSRYLLLLVAIVALNKIVATLIYYQLNPFIEQTFVDADSRTTFTGLFFGGMNVAAFIVQFFFTSWILRRWGLMAALLMLPVGVLAGATGMVFLPVFWLAAATELYDGSLNYSLQQTTKEVLYLPIDRSVRYKVKPFIDMVVFRFGKGIAAVLGIVLLDTMAVSVRWLSYLILPLLAVWIAVVFRIRRDYVGTVRMMLQARAAARRASDEAGLKDTVSQSALHPFGSLTNRQSSEPKFALLNQMVTDGDGLSAHAKELIKILGAYESRPTESSAFAGDVLRLKAVVWDQREPVALRRQAIHHLTRSKDQGIVDYLFGLVSVEVDAVLRHEAVLGLVKLRLSTRGLEFPIKPIRRRIVEEVANYRRIAAVAAILRRHNRNDIPHNAHVLLLLRMLMEESVEQIFRLLMLLYRPEDIHLIYEQLRQPEPYVRADAAELLDNLVDPAMRAALFPILDEDHFLAILEEPSAIAQEPLAAYRVLQEAIWDHNCWLSVTTLCAVGRLRLTTLHQELEKASREASPIISTAARVALQLATSP